MIETIHPAVVLEAKVDQVFESITGEVTVGELKETLRYTIQGVTHNLEKEERKRVRGQMPSYLNDVFHPLRDSEKIRDPDHFRSDAVGYLQLNFPELYHG
jgi:hypothetical protein